MEARRTIVAMGGGGFSMEPENPYSPSPPHDLPAGPPSAKPADPAAGAKIEAEKTATSYPTRRATRDPL